MSGQVSQMIERPYRSGALQACLICRQSMEIQDEVKNMVKDCTLIEVSDWLKTQGVRASVAQVHYFIMKSGIPPKQRITKPKKTWAEKIITYIDELLKLETYTFTLWSLNLRGSSWTVVTRELHKDGLIISLGGQPRQRWEILASKDDLSEWRCRKLQQIEDGVI